MAGRSRLYQLDGTLLAEGPSFRGYDVKSGYTEKLISFAEDCIVYYSGYAMFLFQGVDEKPTEYELPCIINQLSRLDDGTFLIYGTNQFPIAQNEYYVLDPLTGQSSPYRLPDTAQTPRALFIDTETQTISENVYYSVDTYYRDGEFYAYDDKQLSVFRNRSVQTLIDWENSNLDPSGLTLLSILSDDCLLVSYTDYLTTERGIRFLVRTEEQRTKPREVIRIASIGLDADNRRLVHAAIMQFNSDSADYKIEYTDYYNTYDYYTHGAMSQTEQDAFRQARFEEDLLAGITYDAYIFPERSKSRDLLADKELLSDLSPYLTENQLLGCVETAYTTKDGLIALPFFLRLSTLVTAQNTLPSTQKLTWETMFALADTLSDNEALFVSDVYEPLKTVGPYSFLDLDEKTCTFGTDAFTNYLDFLLRVNAGDYTDESLAFIHEEVFDDHTDLHVAQEFSVTSPTAQDSMRQNRVKFYNFNLHSTESISALLLCFQGQTVNYCGYPSDEGTVVMLSSDMMLSIPTTAASPEGAAAFMQYLLGDDIQTCRRVEEFGLPVSRAAMEAVFPVGFIHCVVGYPRFPLNDIPWYTDHPESFVLDYRYTDSYDPPGDTFATVRVTADDRDRFLRFLDRATVVTAADATLLQIIDEEISIAETGARSVAETGKILQSRVSIYINE